MSDNMSDTSTAVPSSPSTSPEPSSFPPPGRPRAHRHRRSRHPPSPSPRDSSLWDSYSLAPFPEIPLVFPSATPEDKARAAEREQRRRTRRLSMAAVSETILEEPSGDAPRAHFADKPVVSAASSKRRSWWWNREKAVEDDDDEDDLEDAYNGMGTEREPFIVTFLEGEKHDPQNFSSLKKSLMCACFGRSQLVMLLGLSLYVLGFALGPMVWAPLSELFGRRIVFIGTYAPFFLFQIGCAEAQNAQTLIILRFLAGAIGSSPMTNSAGVIVDTFSAAQRGPALAIYSLMPFLGPCFGPIVGGYVGEQDRQSWRWIFWISTIYSGLCLIAGCFVPETFAPVILRARAAKLSKKTGKVYRSAYDMSSGPNLQVAAKMRTYVMRPFILLFKELIVFLFAIYASLIYGILYLMFGAYPFMFQYYRGFSTGAAGLPFLAIGVGMFLGLVGIVIDNGGYVKKMQAHGGPLPPEERLRVACVGGILLPISLAWFAASAKGDVHWIVPTLAGVPFGCGMLLVFMSGSSYLVDSYTSIAASAMASNSFVRSLFAAAFPLFTVQMFTNIGASWALAILAFVTLLCAPIPFLFKIYGGRIRAMSTYAQSGTPTATTAPPPRPNTPLSIASTKFSEAEPEPKSGLKPSTSLEDLAMKVERGEMLSTSPSMENLARRIEQQC
ncbi:hypothetical protein MNV49_005633 [Pseudohyphozyma bogoriensis]|nr:hypothetical protein MNV49_005633 [Pseudohyphozyma bogoriensis]